MTPQEHSFRGPHGQNIVYDVHRPEGDPRGVVVIAHGLAEHGRRYGHVAQRLVDAGYLVAIPDHIGHGRSGGKRMRLRRFAEFTDDLDTVIAHVSDDALPTFLIGHSMGGCIALDYALDHQEKLDGLILSGAAVLPGDDLSPLAVKVAPVLGRIAPGLPTTALSSSSISRDPAVVADYDADPLVSRGKIPAGLGGAMIATMQSFPERLPSLQLPVLVMHGGADALTDPKGSELVERLAGSEDKTLVIYDDLFHEIFNEPEQDVVLGEVVSWLERHSPAAS
ncbi:MULTISPECIES: alpha/beta hydrolase [Gordonia]|jgi:alpha-beta hydrolase superfamily lysophospholipase|uniref:Monoacylglycerol lipase n=1 Tax=Gordonia alkanivorans CGMCC 6845 TaxID=1423140 RepID=W9DGE5_9ACTN|nr:MULTISPECIES: alpha/beta hydrolase [Gordonia]ETA08638.1 hydrolase [Gordonia alkanivorans CGMCC 6845]MDH3005298.1 lysophospholipase [Gordonia alkanivorans]MDH3010403.1 lysophospholipase [Gordonia alkanivorans]MDH3014710.1 lysophospholipase [Gordonia alkanivorans]MDH3019199.1 lysophospholipase [Gordonia alkanivorans]